MDSVSALMSPSKARQAASQAKDWAYVTNWLQRKYSPNPVPLFERNEDTLKALLTLAAANDAADEEEELLHRARNETIRTLKAQEKVGSGSPAELLGKVEVNLDDKGTKFLNDLAEAAVMLGSLTPDAQDLGHAIADMTREEFDTAEQIRKVESLQTYLEKELVTLRSRQGELKQEDVYETPADLPAQTAEWIRGTKMLDAKIAEYEDRIVALDRAGPIRGPRIEELMAEEESVLRLREHVKSLEGRVKMFHGLPPDIQESKLEYERVESELRGMVQRRDGMFEGLLDSGKS
ncbi:hypothetical protein AJ80_01719 [Polytolypa hystricis UAMH7299]|uniref:HAUS augmin-like complex subunit 1 n=1 Tax=Polytolypa hystricis (strain UAMH7299) TaxID=1447883 RepID=A0A2B7YZK7_POLH7|nr:hypothetical protein AJ80_01719 [Polytolypa hystricis UAMH7299]